MHIQLNEIIASNYPPLQGDGIVSNFPPLQGEGKGGDGVAQQFSSPFVTAGRHESFIKVLNPSTNWPVLVVWPV